MILILYLEFTQDFNKGVEYFNNGIYNKAESCFVNLLKEDSNNVQIYNMLGLIYHKKKNYDSAVMMFKKGLDLDSTYVPIYVNISRSLQYLKKYDEAINYVQKGLNFDSTSSLLQNLGILYDINMDYTKSVKLLKLAIQKDTTNSSAMYNLAIAYKHCNVRDSSIKYMKKAIIGYYNKGDFTRGEFVGEELLKQDSTDGMIHFYLGEMYLNDNKYENAVFHYQSAYNYDKENLYSLYRISFSYILMNKRELSFDYLEKSLKADTNWIYVDKFIKDIKTINDPFVMFVRGYIMYKKGNKLLANEFLNKFIKEDKDKFWKGKAKKILKEING